jgi:LPS export ABC transporter protein LptC
MDLKSLPKKKRLYLIVLISVGLILAWAFITAGIITHDFNRKQVEARGDEQEALVNGIILTETKNETKYWEIYGDTGRWDSKNGVAQLNKVIGNFYKDNEVSMSFESSKGLYNEETQEIILYENVFVVLKDETSLKADKLTFDIKEKVLNVEGNVIINKKKSFNAHAERAIIDSNYSRFRIIGKTVSKVY